ncbi:MAG: PD-(D/E)XK nuclease family protein [Verrucomicrobiae bacterium]|nr:PD-(D/E)XK nuclease family protein [Verrucomicrobiae bacterium]
MNFTNLLPLPLSQAPDPKDPLEYLSASRLKTFHTCRLQWYFRYIEQIPTTTSPALLVGKVVHAVLQAWNLARWRGGDSSREGMELAFAENWTRHCEEEGMVWNSPEEESKERESALNTLRHYLTHTPIPQEEKPEAVEVRVERDLDAHGLPPLLGIIDLVRAGGKIVDFKTSARSPDAGMATHQNEIQLACYALLYREATGATESGFELHHLVKTKEPKLVVTPMAPMQPDQIRRLVRIMESYVQGIEREDYVPSPGLHCSYCDYYTQCRKWRGGTQS